MVKLSVYNKYKWDIRNFSIILIWLFSEQNAKRVIHMNTTHLNMMYISNINIMQQ